MKNYDDSITDIDIKIKYLKQKIESYTLFKETWLGFNNNYTVIINDTNNKINEFEYEKKLLELKRYDIENNTHKFEINNLETKVELYYTLLEKAKGNLSKANIFNRNKKREEVRQIEIIIDDLLDNIYYLENEDEKQENKELLLEVNKRY